MENKKIKYKEQLLAIRRKSLASFSDMDYRLESTAILDGVEWINDSKSTDVASTHYALSVFNQPLHWIVEIDGGEQDYSILEDLVRHQVRSIACYGVYNSEFENLFGSIVDSYVFHANLEEAVKAIADRAKAYEVVLFSPASFSSDGRSYIERGKMFNRVLKAHCQL
ncbi:MAG: hypothetical protein N4A35_07460 [Flavobacteriales bacterium]|nr:hypothetical protein [Flavobacteriales bacterium]